LKRKNAFWNQQKITFFSRIPIFLGFADIILKKLMKNLMKEVTFNLDPAKNNINAMLFGRFRE
jgi:hypothetical protein